MEAVRAKRGLPVRPSSSTHTWPGQAAGLRKAGRQAGWGLLPLVVPDSLPRPPLPPRRPPAFPGAAGWSEALRQGAAFSPLPEAFPTPAPCSFPSSPVPGPSLPPTPACCPETAHPGPPPLTLHPTPGADLTPPAPSFRGPHPPSDPISPSGPPFSWDPCPRQSAPASPDLRAPSPFWDLCLLSGPAPSGPVPSSGPVNIPLSVSPFPPPNPLGTLGSRRLRSPVSGSRLSNSFPPKSPGSAPYGPRP